MMQTLVHYVHGFNSASTYPDGTPASDKVRSLAAMCAQHGWEFQPHNIDYSEEDDIKAFLRRQDNGKDRNLHIYVGTSLGGLMSLTVMKDNFIHNTHAILINPALFAETSSLSEAVGKPIANYVTGKVTALSPQSAAFIAHLQNTALKGLHPQFGQAIVHLSQDDAVIDAKYTLSKLRPNSHFIVHMHADGGHRFENHWDCVLHDVQQLAQYFPPEA